MELLLSLTFLIFLCIGFYQLQKKSLKTLCKHIQHTYPQEWQKMVSYTLGDDSFNAIATNVRESIKHGALSQIEDDKIKQFHRNEKGFIGFLIIFIIAQQAYQFYLA